MQRSQKVWQICTILLVGLLVSISYHLTVHTAIGARYPLNTFLFRPEANFSDFLDIFRPVQQGSPVSSKLAVYFPFAYIPLYPLIWMAPADALKTVLVLFSTVIFYFFWKNLNFLSMRERIVATIIMSFCTYAVLFCVTRANLEMITICFIMGFLALFKRGKYHSAGFLLACATAMKLYPGVFGVLLLKRRQYKASALTAVATLVFTLGAAAVFPGGIPGTLQLLSVNLEYFKNEYILSPGAIQFSSNYFAVVKLLLLRAGLDVAMWAQALLIPYTLLCLALFGFVVVYILTRERILWKQVCLLSILVITLPEVSFDYKLIYMLLPLGLFISAPPGHAAEDHLYGALFALILIPKAYLPVGHEITLSVVLNPFLMTLMMAHILWAGLRQGRNPASPPEV
jgi:hypothetical protein